MGNLQGSFKDFLLTVPQDEFPQVEDASLRVPESTSIFLNPGRALHSETFLAIFFYNHCHIYHGMFFTHCPDATPLKKSG